MASDHNNGTDITVDAPEVWPTAAGPVTPQPASVETTELTAAMLAAGGFIQAMAGLGSASPATAGQGAEALRPTQPPPLATPRGTWEYR